MKTSLTILILLFSLQVWNSSQESIHQSEIAERKAQAAEEYSELYFMHGIQISKRMCYISSECEPLEVLSSDTLQTSFIVYVRMFENRPDSLMFSGLEGADMGIREVGYTGSAAFGECTSETSAGDCAYAKISGSNLVFDIENSGGYYRGSGTLDRNFMTIETEFIYRGLKIEYQLEGKKVEGEI